MSEPEIISLEELAQEEVEQPDFIASGGLDTWTGEPHDS